jgi:hypothetical protein
VDDQKNEAGGWDAGLDTPFTSLNKHESLKDVLNSSPQPSELKKLARKYVTRFILCNHPDLYAQVDDWGAEGFAYKGYFPQGVDTWLVFERYTLEIAEI